MKDKTSKNHSFQAEVSKLLDLLNKPALMYWANNLGLEGMMLVGAVSAFVTLVLTDSYLAALIVSLISGLVMSGLFAFLVLYLMANQVATGLALTIFGIGISSMIGKKYVGTPIDGLSPYFLIIISFFLN